MILKFTIACTWQKSRRFVNKSIAPWVNLVPRVVRIALMRKDVGYAKLACRLATFVVADDDRALAACLAIEHRVSSYSFRFIQS